MVRMEKTEQKDIVSRGGAPEKKFRAGTISVTVWQNAGKSKKGTEVSFRTVSLQRGYQDSEGEWHNTSSLRTNDLPKVSVVLQKAYEYIIMNSESNIGASVAI